VKISSVSSWTVGTGSAKDSEGVVFTEGVVEQCCEGKDEHDWNGDPPRPALDKPLLVIPENDETDSKAGENAGLRPML
jgi:hypothetical protein